MSIPIPRIFWPITITAGVNDGIVFDVKPTALGAGHTFAGAIAAGTYTSPEGVSGLLTALKTAFEGAQYLAHEFSPYYSGSVTVSLSADGVVSITLGGQVNGYSAKINWTASSAASALAALLGYTVADTAVTVSSNAATFTAQNQMQHVWTPGAPVLSDSYDTALYIRTHSRTVGGQSSTTLHGTVTQRRVVFQHLAASKTFTAKETGSTTNQALQRFIASTGVGRFTYSPDRSDPTTGAAEYFLLPESMGKFEPKRLSAGLEVYSYELVMGAYSA